MRRLFLANALLVFSAVYTFAGEKEIRRVPDASTAKKIAMAILIPVYGQTIVDSEKPYRAELKDGTWMITGTLRKSAVGGVTKVLISAQDGCITEVSHGQ